MAEVHIGPLDSNRSKIGDPTGKAGQIAEIMEQRLMLGHYKPGEMLSFNILADEFGVSRQPVSAAISHLRASGYVEVLPHVGCRVVCPAPAEIEDFFLMLSKIEGTVVALAAKRHQSDEAHRLRELRPEVGPNALHTITGRQPYITYVDAFHELIWQMARSPLLQSKMAGLRRLSNFYLWQGLPTLAPQAAAMLIKERCEIAHAIAARDPEAATHLMERHIRGKPSVTGFRDSGVAQAS